MPPLLLLPPSEGKALGGRGAWLPDSGRFGGPLGRARASLLEALVHATPAERAKATGTAGELLLRAEAAVHALAGGTAPSLPAWRRFTGVVWEHLDPATLTPADRRRILVPSALCGLLRGDDPVPDHRLPMSASLPPLGRLSAWWRPQLTSALPARSTLVDLLPTDYAAAFDWPAVADRCRVVRVELLNEHGRAAGHFAKAAKGAFARHVLQHGLDSTVLEQFRWRDWKVTEVTPDGSTIRLTGSARLTRD